MADGAMSDGFAQTNHRHSQHDGDLFANFSYDPPKSVGHFRLFTHRSRYKAMACLPASREQLGSNTSLSG